MQVHDQHKQADKTKQDEEDAERRAKNLEDAKKIVIEQDKSLAAAEKIRIFNGEKYRGKRVKLNGWVHRLRRQGKGLMFITLRDGSGFLQCILSNQLCSTYNALVLQTESTVLLFGTLKTVPEGKTVSWKLPRHVSVIWRLAGAGRT